VVIPSFGEFPGGKGRRSNGVRRHARGETKSFYLEKVFGEVHLTPCGVTRRCYEQPSAGERPSDGPPETQRGGTRPTRRQAGATLAFLAWARNSEKRRRHRRLQACPSRDGWKPARGETACRLPAQHDSRARRARPGIMRKPDSPQKYRQPERERYKNRHQVFVTACEKRKNGRCRRRRPFVLFVFYRAVLTGVTATGNRAACPPPFPGSTRRRHQTPSIPAPIGKFAR